jgi:hypothetical protein
MSATARPEQTTACDAPDRALASIVEQVQSPQLIELWQRARATWPSVELSAETFLSHVARHLPAELATAEAAAELDTTDLDLACACAMGDSLAVAAGCPGR